MYLGGDSFLLAEQVQNFLKKVNNKKIKILDMGSGTGIQAEACMKSGFKNVLAADIDSEAVRFIKKKNIKAVKSNLFSDIQGSFDLIIFNPPYLPEHKFDKQKDTSGGKKGDETIVKFLIQAKKHLKKNGKIFLLLSSLTPRERINKLIAKDYLIENLAEKRFFFEKLEVWEMKV